jgi:ferredoxin
MAIKITDDCINCFACIAECPNTAIYEEGTLWTMAEGTTVSGQTSTIVGSIDAQEEQEPIGIGDQYFYIAPDKCTECVGFHPEPMCAIACPTDACVPDDDRQETEEVLLAKKDSLHRD